VKHAGQGTLAALAALLKEIRTFGDLTERKPGIFYRKSTAFLHFHEDPAGIFADLKVGPTYNRFRVSTRAEQRNLLIKIEKSLKVS
jgi:hypothetical protein